MAGFNFGSPIEKKKKIKTNYDKQDEEPEKKETYAASIAQSGEDYDDIMARYRKIIDAPKNEQAGLVAQYKKQLTQQGAPPKVIKNITSPKAIKNIAGPKDQVYERGPEQTAAFANMEELSRTGGYSDQDKSDLRSRGISPIRSIYANAQSGVNRQRALSGGYSPSYNASTTKMAREMSEQIGQRVTDVNAGIAEKVAQGKLSAAPQYAQFAQNETSAMNDINARNTESRFKTLGLNNDINSRNAANELSTQGMNNDINARNIDNTFKYNEANRFNQANANSTLERLYNGSQDRDLAAIGGMRGMYGTTPAQPSLYGQQAAEQYRLQPQPKKYRPGAFSFGR